MLRPEPLARLRREHAHRRRTFSGGIIAVVGVRGVRALLVDPPRALRVGAAGVGDRRGRVLAVRGHQHGPRGAHAGGVVPQGGEVLGELEHLAAAGKGLGQELGER